MSRRIDIELTSHRPDGTWTWRAAGAREPKGVVDSGLVPAGSTVSAVLKAEVETDLDGTRVLPIVPPKQKAERTGLLERLPSDKPFEPVTQKLARRDRDSRGGDRRGGKRRDGRPGEGRRDRPAEGGDRPRRKFFEAPPEIPQRPKPKRIRPQRTNVDAVLAELPEAHRAIAEKVLNGGVPAVRAAVEEQNRQAVAEGREKIKADGLVAIAENLLPRLRTAEWTDKALAAERIIDDVDLRDLRSIVVAGDSLSGQDEHTRALLAKMKAALVSRQETETRLWLEDIDTATKVGRVVRALRLSSQPPKAGVPFPPALAAAIVESTVAALTPDAAADRWIALLEAAAFSPVHGKVLPAAVPTVVTEDLVKTVTRLAPLMPQVAALFGIAVDPKARMPRPLQPQRPERAKKKSDATRGPGTRPASDARRSKATPATAVTTATSIETGTTPAVEPAAENGNPVDTPVESPVESPAENETPTPTPASDTVLHDGTPHAAPHEG